MNNSPKVDIALNGRAVRRLLITFLLASALLGFLYASRDRISSYGDNDLLVKDASSAESYVSDYVELDLPVPEEVEPLTVITAKACQARRDFYKRLVASRESARRLKYNAQGHLTNLPYVVSTTQPLMSEVCYSAEETLTSLQHAVDDSVNMCNALLDTGNKTTVVLRLEIDNLFTDDAVNNLRRLIVEVGWVLGLDVNVLQIRGPDFHPDEVPQEFRRIFTTYRKEDVFEKYPPETEATTKANRLGLSYHDDQGSRYSTTFYQFPQVWFMRQEAYSFAYFMDSHVRHTSSYGELFAQLQTAQVDADLLTLDPVVLTRASTLWGPNEASLPESSYSTRMIVHGISLNMARAMKRTLLNGVNAPHEGFMPAVAIKNSLKIAMFAHPILRGEKDFMMVQKYSVPAGHDWTIHNLIEQSDPVTWQHGGTFTADAVKWVEDAPRTKWIDKMYQTWRKDRAMCLPGLLVYPVSGR